MRAPRTDGDLCMPLFFRVACSCAYVPFVVVGGGDDRGVLFQFVSALIW